MWVLDHEADLDADFLAQYGIDLETYDITGPRFLALAHRVTAYGGVMAARVEQQAPQADSPARASGQERTEVTLTAMSVQLPGWIDQVTVPAGEA